MVLTQVGPFLSRGSRTPEFDCQKFEGLVHVSRKDAEFIAYRRARRWQDSGFHGQYGIDETMGTGQHANQQRDLVGTRSRLRLHAVDRGHRARREASRSLSKSVG